jgi:choline transporter-like protein 2/4/5
VGDISKGILIIIVAGLVGGVVISLVWLVILRYLAGFMAWLTILLVNVALCGVTLYCFALAGMLGNNAFGKVCICQIYRLQVPSGSGGLSSRCSC